MHLIFFAYGIQNKVDEFLNSLKYNFYPWRRLNETTGQYNFLNVQGSLRPGMLGTYEYVFPEECLADVITAMFPSGNWKTNIEIKSMNFRTWVFRKMMKLEKIPETYKCFIGEEKLISSFSRVRTLITEGVSVYLIGIRRDETREHQFPDKESPAGYTQEML